MIPDYFSCYSTVIKTVIPVGFDLVCVGFGWDSLCLDFQFMRFWEFLPLFFLSQHFMSVIAVGSLRILTWIKKKKTHNNVFFVLIASMFQKSKQLYLFWSSWGQQSWICWYSAASLPQKFAGKKAVKSPFFHIRNKSSLTNYLQEILCCLVKV